LVTMFQIFAKVYPKLAENYIISSTLDTAVTLISQWLAENTLPIQESID